MSTWKSLSLSQALVLIALAMCVTATVVFAPAHLWEKLADTHPAALASWILTVGGAIVAVFVKGRGESVPPVPPLPRRWEDENDDPTSPAGPRAMRRQSTPPNDSLAPARRNHPEKK